MHGSASGMRLAQAAHLEPKYHEGLSLPRASTRCHVGSLTTLPRQAPNSEISVKKSGRPAPGRLAAPLLRRTGAQITDRNSIHDIGTQPGFSSRCRPVSVLVVCRRACVALVVLLQLPFCRF